MHFAKIYMFKLTRSIRCLIFNYLTGDLFKTTTEVLTTYTIISTFQKRDVIFKIFLDFVFSYYIVAF